jgi:hypothetical protein
MTQNKAFELFGVKGVEHLFPEKLEKGCASVTKFEFDNQENPLYNLRHLRDGNREHYMYDGTYVRLIVEGKLVMSDTAMERITNREFIKNANGRVLIGGLGIGLILQSILDKPEVTEVVVIEKYQDVIDLVADKFTSPKLKIICADIFEHEIPKTEKFDTIYFDIWADLNTENLKEMKVLHTRFRKNKANKDSYMDSWYKSRLQKIRKKERQSSWRRW